jgi:hypothetical protein
LCGKEPRVGDSSSAGIGNSQQPNPARQ